LGSAYVRRVAMMPDFVTDAPFFEYRP
jgi:hypothetical protein